MASRAIDQTGPDALHNALTQLFGFPAFRPGQEVVCRAAFEGRDVLVVMPTGAGTTDLRGLPDRHQSTRHATAAGLCHVADQVRRTAQNLGKHGCMATRHLQVKVSDR